MKDKVLKANVTKAVEALCHELRAYTGESLTCTLTIITRAKGAAVLNVKPDNVPDWYKANIKHTESVDDEDFVLDEAARVFYGPDDFGQESIVLVMPYRESEEGEKDGT